MSSCEKKDLIAENNKWVYFDSSKAANVKLIHCFAGNTPQLPTASNLTTGPQVFVYANGKKLNGNALSYGGQWPSPAVYSSVPSGNNIRFDVVMARLNLSIVPNAPAPIAGDTLATFTQTLENGKYYSFFIGDSIPNFKVTVKEDGIIGKPAYQKFKIRLANWLMSPNDTFNIYSRREQRLIIKDVYHKQISDFVELNLPIVVDTFDVYKTNNATTIFTSLTAFSGVGERMYTLILRGKPGLAGKLPQIGVVTNR